MPKKEKMTKTCYLKKINIFLIKFDTAQLTINSKFKLVNPKACIFTISYKKIWSFIF